MKLFCQTNSRPGRSRALQRVAGELGWTFRRGGCRDVFRFLRDFELYRGKLLRSSANGLRRTDEWEEEAFCLFDFHYLKLLPGPVSRRPHRVTQTVFFVNSRSLELPEFIIRPRSEDAHWLRLWDNKREVAFPFPRHAGFARQYRVSTRDPAFVQAFFSEPLLHFLTYEDGWTIEGLHHLLIIYRREQLIPAPEIPEYLETCRELYTRLRVPTV